MRAHPRNCGDTCNRAVVGHAIGSCASVANVDSTEQRVLVVGAGGHARVCIEALTDDELTTVVGCVSSDGLCIAGLETLMLGVDTDLEAIARTEAATHVFVAIGNNDARSQVMARCWASGLHGASAISRFAMRSHTASIGEASVLMPGAIVNAASRIGPGVIINTGAGVDHDCVIGEFAHIAPGVAIAGGVTIGARAFIGIGARIIPGITIGDDAVVGAGAAVIRDVAAGATVVGVPARVIGTQNRRR